MRENVPDLSRLAEAPEFTDEQRDMVEDAIQAPPNPPKLSDVASAKVFTVKGRDYEFAPYMWNLDDQYVMGQPTNGSRTQMVMIPIVNVEHITVTNVPTPNKKDEDDHSEF